VWGPALIQRFVHGPHGKRFGENEGVGGQRCNRGLAGTSIECAGKWRQFDRRLGEPVELVDERPKLGWVKVAHLIMTKKLIISFVSFWSDLWDCFADCWPARFPFASCIQRCGV
jgi:hypothetical protein